MMAYSSDALEERLDLARYLALKVGRSAMHWRREQGVRLREMGRKGLQDFVTEADEMAEHTIRTALAEAFPDDVFLGEETGRKQGAFGLWIVDPIDGTNNFVHGLPYWAVSIAFAVNKDIVLGAVYDASSDEVFWAQTGEGAFRSETRLQVSGCKHPDEALALIGHARRNPYASFLAKAERLHALGIEWRRMGSACLGLCRVAEGAADLYWEDGVKIWDVAAGILIAREAGAFSRDPLDFQDLEAELQAFACSPELRSVWAGYANGVPQSTRSE